MSWVARGLSWALIATGQIPGPLLGGLVIGWLGLLAGIASSLSIAPSVPVAMGGRSAA